MSTNVKALLKRIDDIQAMPEDLRIKYIPETIGHLTKICEYFRNEDTEVPTDIFHGISNDLRAIVLNGFAAMTLLALTALQFEMKRASGGGAPATAVEKEDPIEAAMAEHRKLFGKN